MPNASGIAGIFNIPSTQNELNTWSFNHSAHHRDIIRSIRQYSNIDLPEYVTDPVPKDFKAWSYQHQKMHDDMNGALGLSGFNLTRGDWENQEDRAGWIQSNAIEHLAVDNAINALISGAGPGPGPPPITPVTPVYADHRETNGVASSYTWAGLSFGTPAANRYIVACFSWFAGSTMSQATINGITALTLAYQTLPSGGGGSGMAIALVPSGATGSINLYLASNSSAAAVAVYAVTGLSALGAAQIINSGAISPTATMNVPQNSAVIAVATGRRNTPPSASWSGLTKDSDNRYNPTNTVCVSTASKPFSVAAIGYPMTCSFSAGAFQAGGCFALFNT